MFVRLRNNDNHQFVMFPIQGAAHPNGAPNMVAVPVPFALLTIFEDYHWKDEHFVVVDYVDQKGTIKNPLHH